MSSVKEKITGGKFREVNLGSMKDSFIGCFYGLQVDLIFFIYNIGDSMLDAVLRPNIPQLTCLTLYPDSAPICTRMDQHPEFGDEVQGHATTYLIYHKMLTNFPALMLGLFCGAWSDKYGRKLPMVMPSLGTTCAVLMYMTANISQSTSLVWFLSASFIHGCFGKTSMITMAVHSYVVDITEKERRTRKLGILAAMQFLGMFLGSLISGLLIDNTTILTTYCAVSFLHALVVILALWQLRETVNPAAGSELCPCRTIFQSSNLTESLMVLWKPRVGHLRKSILALFIVLILHQCCRTGLTDVTLLFTERSPLSWPTSWFGYLSAVDNAAMGFVLLLILPILSNFWNFSDASISIIGLGCASVRFVILAWSKETWMVWVAVVVGSLGGLINSPVRSLLSKLVHEDDIGKIFAIVGSGETIAKFMAFVFTFLYGSTLDIFPGFAFVLAAGLYTVMLIIILLVNVNVKIMDDDERVELNDIH